MNNSLDQIQNRSILANVYQLSALNEEVASWEVFSRPMISGDNFLMR